MPNKNGHLPRIVQVAEVPHLKVSAKPGVVPHWK